MINTSYIEMILPEGVLEFFEATGFTKVDGNIRIYLIEKNIPPEEYKGDKLTSKGFFDEITVQDFPIRNHPVLLHIKRRRWFNETKGYTIYRDWNIVAQGTRITQEFAIFLKGIARYQAH
jgi:hypothetical protein